jgi:hypothetical protein
MHKSNIATTVNEQFYQPLEGLHRRSPNARPCPELLDQDFLRLGVQRVLEAVESGRGFLQEHGPRLGAAPNHHSYFAALRSARRCALVGDVSLALLQHANALLHDRLADIPELAAYECFALDGHWHKAAVHDARHDGSKMAVGHFYSLNLRTHSLRHLTAGEGWHEHDLSALKRVKPTGLRQDVPKGTRVLGVYDKAIIDFGFWQRCRKECAVYFISRVKENMVYDLLHCVEWDRSDARHRGVTEDRRVMTREGQLLRIVCYTDPRTGQRYEFLTNEMDLPPGVIVELYRRRWEVEKVFDQIKNKLGEQKAWATSLEAKSAQAQFIALTHNLLLLYEQSLEKRHGITNEAEDARRQKRTEQAVALCAAVGRPLTSLLQRTQRATQRSVKFIRWLRQSIRDNVAETAAVLRLHHLYATS